MPAGDQQRGRGLEPPAKKAQQVDRGLVGPVHVLDDDEVQHPRLAHLPQQRAEELVAARSRSAQLRKRAAKLRGDVEQRTERTRREQPVAGAP
jgi:hypothetical protein